MSQWWLFYLLFFSFNCLTIHCKISHPFWFTADIFVCGVYPWTHWSDLFFIVYSGCSKPIQQSKPLSGEKTRQYVSYIPLSLTVSGIFASAIMVIAFFSYRKKRLHNKAKQVYFCGEQAVDCNGKVGSSVKSVWASLLLKRNSFVLNSVVLVSMYKLLIKSFVWEFY